jgi:hypothetical protein
MNTYTRIALFGFEDPRNGTEDKQENRPIRRITVLIGAPEKIIYQPGKNIAAILANDHAAGLP